MTDKQPAGPQQASQPPKAPSELRKERLEREKLFLAGRQADLKREAAERRAKREPSTGRAKREPSGGRRRG